MKKDAHPLKSFIQAACILGGLIGCAESIFRIEMGTRYYTASAALTSMVIITLAYCAAAGIYSTLIYLVVLAYRRATGRPREASHVPRWGASLAWTTIIYLIVLVLTNKWIFTSFELFSGRGLVYTAVLSLLYWGAALLVMKLVAARFLRWNFAAPPLFLVTASFLIIGAIGLVCLHKKTAGPGGPPAASGHKTNLILISIDTLRRDRVGCLGSGMNTTPNIDKLYAESISFHNAYCEIPVTNPSHVTMLTGLSIASHGNKLNGDRLNEGTLTLASIMKRENYRTAAFVSAIPLLDRLSNLSAGFDIYDDNLWSPEWVGDSFLLDAISLLVFKIVHKGGVILSIPADEVMTRATRWIDHHADQPFFAFIHLYDPHAPYDPPAEYAEMYAPASTSEQEMNNALYNGEVRFCDHEIGKFIDRLQELDLLSRSILVITSDHGEELGENDGEFGHGHFLWEESVRVPLLVRLPDWESAADERFEFCQLVDLVPTMLPLLGLHLPEGAAFDGSDLLANSASHSLPLLFQSSPAEGRIRFAVLDPPWKLINRYDLDGDQRSLQKEWLFNLVDDPFENDDLLEDDPLGTVAKLQFQLDEYCNGSFAQKNADRRLTDDDIRRLKALGYLR